MAREEKIPGRFLASVRVIEPVDSLFCLLFSTEQLTTTQKRTKSKRLEFLSSATHQPHTVVTFSFVCRLPSQSVVLELLFVFRVVTFFYLGVCVSFIDFSVVVVVRV